MHLCSSSTAAGSSNWKGLSRALYGVLSGNRFAREGSGGFSGGGVERGWVQGLGLWEVVVAGQAPCCHTDVYLNSTM